MVRVDELKAKRKSLRRKYHELKHASEGAWEELKVGMGKAWEELKPALQSAIAKFK